MKKIIFLLSFLLAAAVNPAAPTIQLDSTKGDYVSLADYKGKVVVVSWWATWCKPCIMELKFLNKLAKKYPKDLVVIAIATDGPETQAAINSTVHSKGLDNLIVLLDATGDTNPTGMLPYSIYVDREGTQCHDQRGFVSGDEPVITKKVLSLINKKNFTNPK